MNSFPEMNEFIRNITRRAVKIKRSCHFLGVFSCSLIIYSLLMPSPDWYEFTVGAVLLLFLFSTRGIDSHFYITWSTVVLKTPKELNKFTPIKRWLVHKNTKEISPELYEELCRLVAQFNNKHLNKKLNEVLECRNGVVTHYDLANIAFMSRGLVLQARSLAV